MKQIDTLKTLQELSQSVDWDNEQVRLAEFLSDRFEASRTLYKNYTPDGKKASNAELTEIDLLYVVLRRAIQEFDKKNEKMLLIKCANAFFKLFDAYGLKERIAKNNVKVLAKKWLHTPVAPHSTTTLNNKPKQAAQKTIPLTVLFYEGPIARAYLETLKSLGFKPQSIIVLTALRDVATHKPVGWFLPKSMRLAYAASTQRRKIHYWPQILANKYKIETQKLFAEIAKKFVFDECVLAQAQQLNPLETYSDDVRHIGIETLNDPKLKVFLEQLEPSVLLFTGGGIMPKSLLNIPHLKFLHVHPGFLPDIRGGDCMLWSQLVAGCPSATCFYMAPGIDKGDIIKPAYLPAVDLSVLPQGADAKTRYRLLYSFLDPWIRSAVLRDVVVTYERFNNLPATPQQQEGGRTYYFMHPALVKQYFAK